MSTLQIIEMIVGFLTLLYLWIGAFRLADNWDALKEWSKLEDRRFPLWFVATICLLAWPSTDYNSAREEIKKVKDGQKEEESQLSPYGSRRSPAEIQGSAGRSRLYNERSLDEPEPRRQERVASYYDPYEHARWDESDFMAISGVVGGDDSDWDRRRMEESRNAEGYVPSNGWETYSPPSSLETPAAPSSSSPCRESSSSDSGVGSDSSGSYGSDSSPSSNDSGGCSGGGE